MRKGPLLVTGLAAAAAALAAGPRPARAHRLIVWAAAEEGPTIRGRAYLSGGGRARGIAVRVLGPGGEPLGTVTTDDAGEFLFRARTWCDHRFVARTADGHRAETVVPAVELPRALPRPPGPAAEKTPAGAAAEPAAGGAAEPGPEAAADAELARRLADLRAELHRRESRIRIRNVLGGAGYIVGLAGIAFFLKGRADRRAVSEGA